MKKFISIIFIMMTGLMTMSCHKMKSPVEYTTVKFDYKMVEGNSMVKSSSGNEIVNEINNLLPEKITITLTSLTDKNEYTCETGKIVTLPVGEYNIRFHDNYTYRTSSIPTFEINQNITISKDIKNYTINATYTCCAIIYDTKEVKSLSIVSIYDNKDSQYPNCHGFGTFEKIFFYNTHDSYADKYILDLITYPDDPDFVSTKIKLTKSYNKTSLFIEPGKYYYIHPNTVTKTENNINVKFPDWKKGEI